MIGVSHMFTHCFCCFSFNLVRKIESSEHLYTEYVLLSVMQNPHSLGLWQIFTVVCNALLYKLPTNFSVIFLNNKILSSYLTDYNKGRNKIQGEKSEGNRNERKKYLKDCTFLWNNYFHMVWILMTQRDASTEYKRFLGKLFQRERNHYSHSEKKKDFLFI